MSINYYNVLNISIDATLKEIKSSFNELSKRYHPDINPEDKYSQEKYKIILDAYNTLSNYEKRIEYEKYINNENIKNENIKIENDNKSFDNIFKEIKLLENKKMINEKYEEPIIYTFF